MNRDSRDIVMVILMCTFSIITLNLVSSLQIKNKIDSVQCWTNTIPQETHTWHLIKCPKSIGD